LAHTTSGANRVEDSASMIAQRGKVPEGRPRFLIAYQNGNIQLMCNENISSKKNKTKINVLFY
jgi:hypothetical protein